MKFVTICILLIQVTIRLNAQWTQSDGIHGATVGSFVATDSMLFCSAPNVYRTPGDSICWELLTPAHYGLYIAGNCVFELSPGPGFSALRSFDNGETWEEVSFPDCTIGGLFVTTGSSVFVTKCDTGQNYLVCRSDDYGTTWNDIFSWDSGMPYKLFANDSSVFALYMPGKIFYSNDLGNTWDSLSVSGLNNLWIWDMFKFHSDYWLTNVDGVYKYNNISGQWVFQQSSQLHDYSVFQGNLYATGSGILLYDSISNIWIPQNNGLETSSINCLFPTDSVFYCGTLLGPYRRSADSPEWEPVFNGLHGGYVTSISCNEEECWITTDLGVYKSLDNGHFFEKQDLPGIEVYQKIIITDSTYYIFSKRDFCFSEDHGLSWQTDTTGLPIIRSIHDMTVACGEVFILCSENYFSSRIFKSIPGYSGWELTPYMDTLVKFLEGNDTAIITATGSSSAIEFPLKITYNKFIDIDTINVIPVAYYPLVKYAYGSFLIGESGDLYYSEDDGINWTEINFSEGPVENITKKDDLIVICGNACGGSTGVFASNDSGENWQEITDNLGSFGTMFCSDVNINGERVFLSTWELGIIYRDDLITGIRVPSFVETENIFIYPNPSSDKITITTNTSFKGTMTISNILGKIILEEKICDKKEIIIKDLEQGMYIINLADGRRTLSSKLLKVDN